MNISVWDTYVPRSDGKVMHFDILVPDTVTDTQTIFGYGKKYLAEKPFDTLDISSEECKYCHTESAIPEVLVAIQMQGYYIIEMENCD